MANEADGEKKGPAGERVFPLPEGYDAVGEAKRLLRSIRAGALATLTQDGFPFASLVNVATDFDGSPLLLMSSLSASPSSSKANIWGPSPMGTGIEKSLFRPSLQSIEKILV